MTIVKSATLKQLATFRAVARRHSVTSAASELHLSQSAVSIQIASLEASAGTQLISRTGRGVRLTEAGELLLGYADRLLSLWHETSDEMATFLGEFTGTLRVGAVTTAEYWLPRLLVQFVADHPRVRIKLHVANRDEVVRAFAAQEIDIAVMGRPPNELKVVAAVIAKNAMGFVVAPQHALMAGSRVSMARLAQEPLLVRERGSGTRNTVEWLFAQAGLAPCIGSELSTNESIKQMCAANFGPAFLSLHTCVLEMNAGLLALLPMAGNPIERDWFVVRPALRQLPQVAVAFEDFLRQQAQAEIHRQLPPLRLRGSAAARKRPGAARRARA